MTTVNPSSSALPGTGGIEMTPVQSTLVTKIGTSGVSPLPPPSAGSAGFIPGTGAPALPEPVTGLPKDLDVEALVKLISEQSRKELTDSTIETIKTKGQRKLDLLKDQIEQIKKQLEEARKPFSWLKKIFSWIGAIFSAIAAAVAVVFTAGAATPLLVGACIMAGVAIANLIDQIIQEASGGKASFAKGFSKMLQAFGVDEKTADIVGMAVVGGTMLAGTLAGAGLTMGAGAGAAISNIAKLAKTIAAVTQASLAIVNGSLGVAGAVSQYNSDMAGVKLNELRAMLEKLRALTEQEEDFLKVMVEEEQLIVKTVQKIVEGLQETTQVILSGGEGGVAAAAPSMA